MNVETFLEQFAYLAEAPNGIPKLRKLILQLAVRGQLVTQNPNDEPASELLTKIQAEKKRLVDEGTIRDRTSDTASGEVPYELPSGWAPNRLVDIGDMRGGGTPSKRHPEYWDGSIPWVSPKDMKSATVNSSQMSVTKLALEETSVNLIPAGSILIVARSGILKRTLPVAVNAVACVVNQDIKVVVPFLGEISGYVRLMLRGHEDFILSNLVKQGMTVQSLLYKEFEHQAFGLPPLAEQKRIVAKVDELMALCDDLAAKQQAVRTKQIALNRASLHALTEPNETSLATAWHLIRDHFDHLYTSPETVAELRQTILQLAVMGRLVPQDPTDEPASELLKKIQAEKHRLIAEGKIRDTKPAPKINAEDVPFELPIGWAWARLPELVAYEKHAIKRGPFGSAIKKAYFVPNGYKVYEQQHAISGDFARGSYYILQEKFEELASFEVKPGDVIVSCSGTVGRTAIAPDGIERGIINQALLKVTLNPEAMPQRYFRILFEAYVMSTELLSELAGTAQKNIVGVKVLKALPLPLPPTAEQKRIVAKVDQLMTLCDNLEAKLQQTQNDADNLLTAIVHELVEVGQGAGTA